VIGVLRLEKVVFYIMASCLPM